LHLSFRQVKHIEKRQGSCNVDMILKMTSKYLLNCLMLEIRQLMLLQQPCWDFITWRITIWFFILSIDHSMKLLCYVFFITSLPKREWPSALAKNKNKTKIGKLDPRPYTYQALTENIYTRKKNISLILER
jgi:hypothetical protein